MTTSPQTPPTADIVIVNWNTGHHLRDCLRSIAAADRSRLPVRRVVVVDNASDDDSLDGLPATGTELEVIRNRSNRGFAAGCNQGATRCAAEFLLFLNPDTELDRDALREVGGFLRTDTAKGVGICGAFMVDARGRPAISCSRFPTLRILLGKMTGLDHLAPRLFPPHHLPVSQLPASGPVDQVIGAFFLVRRALFTELGGFDERYFLYYEETDFALRARRAGWRSHHVGRARVRHIGQVSSGRLGGRRLGYSLDSRIRFAFRHWSRGRARSLLALTLTVEPVARLTRAAYHRSAAEAAGVVRGYADFLRRLLRNRSRDLERRCVDVVFALTLLGLLAPLLAVLACSVRLGSRGPALFRQQRVGEAGRLFTLYKFRSMTCDAGGPEVTGRSDGRVTGTGRLLRRLGLDELPQLWNVLRGDMTLVGPRPEVPDLARRYPPECRWVFRHRPGLTGPCQLRSRQDADLLDGRPDPEQYYLDVLVPRRVALDAEFLAHATLPRVLRFTLRTAWYLVSAVWPRKGKRAQHATETAGGGPVRCAPW